MISTLSFVKWEVRLVVAQAPPLEFLQGSSQLGSFVAPVSPSELVQGNVVTMVVSAVYVTAVMRIVLEFALFGYKRLTMGTHTVMQVYWVPIVSARNEAYLLLSAVGTFWWSLVGMGPYGGTTQPLVHL